MDLPEYDSEQTVPTAAQNTRVHQRAEVPQPTVPHHVVQPPVMRQSPPQMRPQLSAPHPNARKIALPPRSRFDAKSRRKLVPYMVVATAAFGVSTILATLVFLLMGMATLGSNQILPGVSVAGVSVGGLRIEEAVEKLSQRWPVIILTDGATNRQWQIEPSRIGIMINAQASAVSAYDYGRDTGDFLGGLLGAGIPPILDFDASIAHDGLQSLAVDIAQPAINAGIALENGQVRATLARDGRTVDLEGTIAVLASDPAGWLTHGEVPLKMVALGPAIIDASPILAAAQQMLASPLTVDVFDPASGAIVQWSAAPESWAGWITAAPDSASANGLRLSLDAAAVRAFVAQGEAQLSGTQYIDADQLVADMQNAVGAMNPLVTARVYHRDRQHVVQSGETIISIAYQQGVPYPWIQRANGGIEYVNVGQTITIPSPDNFFQFEPVKNKRIIVSISEQRVRVYENGGLKWDWAASTGINNSPTWPGIYQIISHYPNAYAGNWNLWMPQFMGVYQPIPGADFTNGFHGFPTRGGGQILWENSIGTRVTYGCILLNNTNAQLLYDWAEEGVVVEIRA